jgi:hypothetical protein
LLKVKNPKGRCHIFGARMGVLGLKTLISPSRKASGEGEKAERGTVKNAKYLPYLDS